MCFYLVHRWRKPEFGFEGTKALLDLFRHYMVLGVNRSDAEFLVQNVFGYISGTRYVPSFEYQQYRDPIHPNRVRQKRVVVGYEPTPFVEPRVEIDRLVNIPPVNAQNGTTCYLYSPTHVAEFCTYTAADYYTLCPYARYLDEVDTAPDVLIDTNEPSLYQIRPFSAEERQQLELS